MTEQTDEFSRARAICDYEEMEDMYRDLQEQVAELKLIIATIKQMTAFIGNSVDLNLQILLGIVEFVIKVDTEDSDDE